MSHEKNRLEREALGGKPKCPDCYSGLYESVIVPYWLVCGKCKMLMSPTFEFKKKLADIGKQQDRY